jgi:thiol:disulfide interchange protein DsbC
MKITKYRLFPMNISKILRRICMPCLLALSFDVLAASPTADESLLLASLKKAHPGTHFSSVARTPIPGWYEVWMGSNVAYVNSKNLRYLVFGRLFDTQSMTDLTAPKLAQAERLQQQAEERHDDAPVLPIAQLPLADAIKTVHGNGGDASRSVVVFSDPACPYCKRLEPELDKIDNVTIYTFLVPFQGVALPTAIWCAADRQQAWRQAMHEEEQNGIAMPNSIRSIVPSPVSCATPLDRNLALAQRLKVQGTPTLFFANERRIDGVADAIEIEAQIKRTSIKAGSQADPLPGASHAPTTNVIESRMKETTP